MVNFVPSKDMALWDFDREMVYAIKVNGETEYSTGIARTPDANAEWLPVVDAFPEDYVEGQPWMLGRAIFEIDPGYSPDTVIRSFPEADFSPDAFKRDAENRIFREAQAVLTETDWLVVRASETGEPIPQEILDARAAVREAVDFELSRLDGMTPPEFVEFHTTKINEAAHRQRKALQERRDRQRASRGKL